MTTFLQVAGVVWILFGVAVAFAAKSAVHEILACLVISFGIMFLAFVAVIDALEVRAQPEGVKRQ